MNSKRKAISPDRASVKSGGAQPNREDVERTAAMKNIQVIDGALNCVYDVFAVSDEDHALLFPDGTDIAFAEDFERRPNAELIFQALERAWRARLPKAQVMGIHGIVFYGLSEKRQFYPTLRDEEARNPDGTRLRR